MSVLARLLTRAGEDDPVTLVPMQRRHLRAIMPIEQAAYPTAWSRSVFESELDQVRGGSRQYLVARRGNDIVGYAGLWFVPDPDGDQAHVTNIVVASSLWRTTRSAVGAPPGPSRCGLRTRRRKSCTAGSASRPPASVSATTTTPRTRS
jgi:hypothetical protein